MGKIIGIDLGTTNSVTGFAGDAQPTVLDSKEGQAQIRSVVGLKKRKTKDGNYKTEFLIGDVAEDNWEMSPEDTIVSVKRLMGRGIADADVQKIKQWAMYDIVEPSDGTKESVRVIMGGKEYSPIDISTKILEKIKEDAEYRFGEKVTHAVITVPAYFSQIQHRATRQAGVNAGLTVIKILEEPTAAAIAFGMNSQESAEFKYILVYDLGGGTFDISVLLWSGNTFATLALQGDMWLGGDNFDQVIVEKVVSYIRTEYDVDPLANKRLMIALKRQARAVKERLSSSRSADLIIPNVLQDKDGDPVDIDIEITREEFEHMIKPLVDKSVRLTEKALENAALSCEQIDHVLMAGNATNVPLVQEAMEQMFGKEKVLRKQHPKHCVALGAAITATMLGECIICECGHVNQSSATTCEKCGAILQERIIITTTAPFHYGTQTAGDKFNVFISKGDPYPTENPQTLTFYTKHPNQRITSIPVYGGENIEKASANEKQGDAFAVLPPNSKQGTAIRIKLWLDDDGIFALQAHLEDGTDLQPIVLQGEADKKAVEAIQQGEKVLRGKVQAVPDAKMQELEQAREEAFKKLKQRDFPGALKQAEHFQQLVENIDKGGTGPGPDPVLTKANNLVGYTQFIVSEFSWALGPNQTYQLTNLMGELQQALGSGNRKDIEQKVNELAEAINNLPDIIQVLVGVEDAINDRIRPVDPECAEDLLEELKKIQSAFKAGDQTATNLLNEFSTKVVKAIKDVDGIRPAGIKCSCGAEVGGEQYCPECGEDTLLLQDKTSSSLSGGIIN